MWLWPVAILLSLPFGGLIADLVINGVDSVGTALAGGLIAGSIIGAAGWFVLRKRVSWLWIPAYPLGFDAVEAMPPCSDGCSFEPFVTNP